MSENDSLLPKVRRLPKRFWFVSPAFYVALIASAAYAISTRTLDDLLRYPLQISTLLAFPLAQLILFNWVARKFPIPTLRAVISVLLLLLFAGFTYYCFGVVAKDMYAWIYSPIFSRPIALLVTGMITIVVGSMLFLLRLKLRCIYGLSEAVVGVTVAVHRVSIEATQAGLPSAGLYLAVLTAGIYLVVRGLDNMHQGLTKEPIDPYALIFATKYFGYKSPAKASSSEHGSK